MNQSFYSTTHGVQSPNFFPGSDGPPISLMRSETEIIRGYHLESMTLTHDFSLPLSAFTDFLYCPVYAYLCHVKGVRADIGSRGIIGLITHHTFQRFLLKEFQKVCEYRIDDGGQSVKTSYLNLVRYLVEQARSSLSFSLSYGFDPDIVALRLKTALSRWVEILVKRLQRFAEDSGLEGRELAKHFVPFRRLESTYQAPEIGVSGVRIDVVEGRVPLEIKSWEGGWARLSGVHKLQVALSSLVMEASEGFNVDKARLAYVYDVKLREVDINKPLRRWALEVRNRALDTLSKEKPPKVKGCEKSCPLTKYCLSARGKCLKGSGSSLKHLNPHTGGGSR